MVLFIHFIADLPFGMHWWMFKLDYFQLSIIIVPLYQQNAIFSEKGVRISIFKLREIKLDRVSVVFKVVVCVLSLG